MALAVAAAGIYALLAVAVVAICWSIPVLLNPRPQDPPSERPTAVAALVLGLAVLTLVLVLAHAHNTP